MSVGMEFHMGMEMPWNRGDETEQSQSWELDGKGNNAVTNFIRLHKTVWINQSVNLYLTHLCNVACETLEQSDLNMQTGNMQTSKTKDRQDSYAMMLMLQNFYRYIIVNKIQRMLIHNSIYFK